MSTISLNSTHNHCPTGSKTSDWPTNHTDPALLPLLSIPQIQYSTLTSNSAPSTASTSSSVCSTRPGTNVGRQKRRKLRSSRAGSSSSFTLTPPLSPDLPVLRPRRNRAVARAQPCSDPSFDTDDDELAPPTARLQLTRVAPPVPPSIPADVMIAPSRPSYSPISWVSRSYNTPPPARHVTHTCIRTSTHFSSVPVCTKPTSHFEKMQPKQGRGIRAVQPSGASQALLESRRATEQEKWWWWSKPCLHTGDSNKSAHLPALRCLDLDGDYQKPHMAIITKQVDECSVEHRKFSCFW